MRYNEKKRFSLIRLKTLLPDRKTLFLANAQLVQGSTNPVHLNLVEEEMLGCTLEELQEYIQAKSEEWMSSENGIGSANWELIESYNSEIDDNCYRVVLRVGFNDYIENGVLDRYEEWDYHWWYQTSTGDWADKQGPLQSTYNILTAGEDPTSWDWYSLGNVTYNSSGVFYQIRDVRDISWS